MQYRKTHKKTSLLLLLVATINMAQSGGDFSIKKSTIAAGGDSSYGGDFAVSGTVGQVDASNAITGGDFSLTGGFWSGTGTVKNDIIFKHGFEQ